MRQGLYPGLCIIPIHFFNFFMSRIYSSEVLEHIADENISDVDFMWSNEEEGDVRKISIFKTL